jgi:hypothetical protein
MMAGMLLDCAETETLLQPELFLLNLLFDQYASSAMPAIFKRTALPAL